MTDSPLPRSKARRTRSAIPDEVRHREKWRPALDMLDEITGQSPRGWGPVAADAVGALWRTHRRDNVPTAPLAQELDWRGNGEVLQTVGTSTAVLVEDERLTELIDADVAVELLGTGATWGEGPLWLAEREVVLWSDIPGNRILCWDARTGEVSVERAEAEFTNGRTLDLTGRIVTCSHGRRAVERTEPDGETHVLVDRFGDARLNSPNDVVVAADGAIWFTDPPYGITLPQEGHPGEREYEHCYVFRFEPDTGRLDPVVTDMVEPNGLAFSPDESLLYVSDTALPLRMDGAGGRILVYDVVDGRCANGRLFARVDPGVSDGFRVDVHGNVWTSSKDSIQVFAPDGHRLGKIPVPEKVGNLCFGGPGYDTLFIAASTGLYRLRTRVRGCRPGRD